jgi:hypothetical protein
LWLNERQIQSVDTSSSIIVQTKYEILLIVEIDMSFI